MGEKQTGTLRRRGHGLAAQILVRVRYSAALVCVWERAMSLLSHAAKTAVGVVVGALAVIAAYYGLTATQWRLGFIQWSRQ
ncbi:hypothetical protein OKW40_004536 [Paraburkholderia sp. RAU6.4a]